jgi:hypothetical protein
MTVTFTDGRVKLDLPVDKVLDDQQLTALFDSVTEYLNDIGVDCGGQFGLSIVVDYKDH